MDIMTVVMSKNKYEIDMCNGPIMSKLIRFSLPLVLSSNLQLLFNAVDIIVVGKFSGSQALAAVGSTTALINLMIMLLLGISLGASVLAGRYYSTQNHEGMEATVHTSMAFALGGGLVLMCLGIAGAEFALELMDTPVEVLAQACLYMRVYFLALPFFMLYTYGAAILRAVGDTKRPLMFLVVAGALNVLMNLLLVVGFKLGVLGVAIATALAECVSCVLVIYCLCRVEGSYRLSFKRLRIELPYLKEIMLIGLPAGLQSLVINFSNVLLQASVNSFGPIAIAGSTAANNIFGFLYVTSNSFSQACMNFTSQNYGQRKWDRIARVLLDCGILSVGIMIVLGCGVYAFGESILTIYTSEGPVIQAAMDILLYTTTTYFIFSIMDLLPGSLRGLGYATVPMLLSIVGTVGVRIFWIFCVFPTYHSLDILFISYPLSWIITVLMQIVYFRYIWVKERRMEGELDKKA